MSVVWHSGVEKAVVEKAVDFTTINLCRSICKILGKTLDDLFWEE